MFSRVSLSRGWRPVLLVALAGAGALGLSMSTKSWASDHADAPSLVSDPTVDITDVFAFTEPAQPGRMVLMMTVHPSATSTSTFEEGVEYAFRLVGYDTAAQAADPSLADLQIVCRFQGASAGNQVVLCSANGFSALASFGQTDAGADTAPLRVFAGLRADPAFGDVAKLKETMAKKTLSFTTPGTNAFDGKNVLALVVELDTDAVLFPERDAATTSRPVLAVTATTERL